MADKDETAVSVAGAKTVAEVVERLLNSVDASGVALLLVRGCRFSGRWRVLRKQLLQVCRMRFP